MVSLISLLGGLEIFPSINHQADPGPIIFRETPRNSPEFFSIFARLAGIALLSRARARADPHLSPRESPSLVGGDVLRRSTCCGGAEMGYSALGDVSK